MVTTPFEMKNITLLTLQVLVCFQLGAQNKFDVLPYWKYYQAKTPHTYHLLMETALEQLEARNAKVAKIKTPSDWKNYRTELHRNLKKSLGEFPAKTPLNPKVTSSVESDGILVENILFESMPGYFVSASFFKRKDLQGKKLPVIVYCSGHAGNGYRSEGYQHIILNYAKKGFAVFAFDPIGQGERIQYRKEDGKAAMGTTHDHSYSGSGAFLLGYSPAKYFIWDGIRAIDYLETRPDVDAKRIGIAGRSGGGTQSSYIAAVDNRIVAAAPECYITTYEMLLKSKGPQDAEQVFLHGIANGIDIPDLLHMRAPKPTLVVTTTNDIFSIQGVYDMKKELSTLYQMAGVPGNFVVVEDNAGHAPTKLNREACYRFFAEHLKNPCQTDDEAVQIFRDEQLYASPNGDVFQITGSKRLSEIIAEIGAPKNTGKANVETIARTLNYQPAKVESSSIYSGTLLGENYKTDKYLIKGPRGYFLPTVIFKKEDKSSRVAVYFNSKGKTADTTQILKLLTQFDQVICSDLSGIGELSEYYNWSGDAFIQQTPLNLWFLALLTDQSLTKYRLEEMDALYAFIRAQSPQAEIVGVAEGMVASDLLHWSILHQEKLRALVLVEPLLSFKELVAAEVYKVAFLLHTGGGMLTNYDLPDLYRQFPVGKLKLVNPVNANGEPLEKSPGGVESTLPPESIRRVKDILEVL